ncbi:nucleoside triphosphate pyrophosphohydrolase family protein [Paenibacillus psychroresistens]|uniref:MazG-like protein n=1 Tax=Paenibacillus psychroresistens TaxID=1778678 RepID=UPI001D04C51D|nr:MazG-like protein [Paenibacillus psychroresistens]
METKSLGREWTVSEDMLGFFADVGLVGRLVMAAEGPWGYGGDVNGELKHKLAESLWWILVLSERLNVDISEAFSSFMSSTETKLTKSV